MKITRIKLAMVAIFLTQAQGNLVDDFFKKAFDQLRPRLKNIYAEDAQLANIKLKNLFIDGLDEFYTTALNVALLPLKINNMTVVIDDVQAEGTYRMNQQQLPGPIVVSGAGELRLRVKGIKLYIQATLSSKQFILYMKDILDVSVYVDTIELEMTGLVDGGPVGELISKIISKVAKPVFNIVVTPALLANRPQLIVVINNILSTIKV